MTPRESDLERLRRTLIAALDGRAGIALVSGEPGIGKSHTLRSAAAYAAEAGATVLHGGASEAEGMPPYLPFLEAVGDYLRVVPIDVLREQAGGPRANVLATIFPELPELLGALPPGPALPPEQSRLRLYEAVRGLLLDMSRRAPVVLVLDDLQWADGATLDLIVHVMRRRSEARLLILGAYRESEREANPALERAIAELNRLRVLVPVRVRPLSLPEVSALAETHLGAPLVASAAELLHAQSEGNPFFAEELLRGWRDGGALLRRGSAWYITGDATSHLPPGIVSAIRQRLSHLPAEVVDMLRIAAIIGRAFPPGLLATAAGRDIETVEDRLLQASRAGLVRPAEDVFLFTHDKIRESLYAEVSTARRTRLHEGIGRALEDGATEGSPQQVAALAFHFANSTDTKRAVRYARRAGLLALDSYAAEEAVGHLRTALRLLPPDDEQRGELLLRLGDACRLADKLGDAVAAYRDAHNWWLRRDDTLQAARARHGEALAHWRLEELPRVLTGLREALDLLAGRPLADTAQVQVDLATLLGVDLLRQDEGLIHGRQAIELARQLRDGRLEAAATRTVGYLLITAADQRAGLSLLEKGLALASAGDHLEDATESCAYLANAWYWTGNIEEAYRVTERRLEFAASAHNVYQQRNGTAYLAFVHVHRGEWARADEVMGEWRGMAERLAGPLPEAFLQQICALMAYHRGDHERAAALLEEAVSALRHTGQGVLVWMLGLLLLTHAEVGETARARELSREIEGMVTAITPGTIAAGAGLVCLVLSALALGETQRALGYRDALRNYSGLQLYFLTDRALGMLDTLGGDKSRAEEFLRRAEETARRESLRPELGRTLAACAELVLTQGGPGSAVRARNLFGQARDLFRELHMARDAERVHARLRALPPQPGQPARATTPARLSDREIEVLRLVVAGLSNRQIGERLYLSEKTVANHLTSIFTKTNTDNRAAATAFALRHDLA